MPEIKSFVMVTSNSSSVRSNSFDAKRSIVRNTVDVNDLAESIASSRRSKHPSFREAATRDSMMEF